MFKKMINRWIDREVQLEREALPLLDWKATLKEISHLLEENAVYLEERAGGLITQEEHSRQPRDIVGMAIAIADKDLKPWETEEPASLLATKVSNYLGREAILLISRDTNLFVGYFVLVRAQ